MWLCQKPFPGGRLQCFSVAWDVPEERWFFLYPGQEIPSTDWLHWTRPAANWNTMCSECHSTAVRKRYDPEADTFETTWSEIAVGCETCHGPGSLHNKWAKQPAMARPQVPNALLVTDTSEMSQRDLVNLCMPCHSRRGGLRDQGVLGGEPLDSMLPVVLAEGLYHADGQILDEVFEYHSFIQSKMFEKDVRCSDCHDVHSGKRHEEGNKTCLNCHRADTYDTPDHHFHKLTVDGKPSEGASCPACHMPGQNYMVVHFRRDHSIRVPRPDLSAEFGTPNACTQETCHADKPLEWSLEAYNRWYGEKRKPHYGTVIAAAREGRPEAEGELIALAADQLRPTIVRATAMDLLWHYPGEESTKVLVQGLADDDPLIRRTAVNRYSIGAPAGFIKAVAPLLKDPVLAVRIATASRFAVVPQELLTESQRADFEAALEEYRETLAYSADMPSGRYNWALLEQDLGQEQEAEKQYRKAIEMDDQLYMAKANLALLLSRRGELVEAETLLTEASEIHPGDAAVAFNLGLLLAERGKTEEAEVSLRRALEANPNMAQAAFNLAILVAPRDLAEAVELSGKAAEVMPENPRYAYTLAYFQAQSGDSEGAAETLEALVARYPGYGDAVVSLGEIYEKRGGMMEMMVLYERALASDELSDEYRRALSARVEILRKVQQVQ